MSPVIAHIYGPVYVSTYGITILLGLFVSVFLAVIDERRAKLCPVDKFLDLIVVSVAAAIVGGRLLGIILEAECLADLAKFPMVWEGGFSVLGSIVAIVIVIPWYLKRANIVILPTLDLFATYAPLLQSISRLGCLAAGCCHGIPTTLPWGIVYGSNYAGSGCAYGIPIHPTQIYSSIAMLFIFAILLAVRSTTAERPGLLFGTYLLLFSIKRGLMDILRADSIPLASIGMPHITLQQAICTLISTVGIILIVRAIWGRKIESKRR